MNVYNVWAVGGAFVLRTYDAGSTWSLIYPLGYSSFAGQAYAPTWNFITLANAAQGFIGGTSGTNNVGTSSAVYSWCAIARVFRLPGHGCRVP